MGGDACTPLQISAFAINGEAKDGGQIAISLDYNVSSIGNNMMAADLCVGWAFGQLHALVRMQSRFGRMAITDLPRHVELSERVQSAKIAESFCNSRRMLPPIIKVSDMPHLTTWPSPSVEWVGKNTQLGPA